MDDGKAAGDPVLDERFGDDWAFASAFDGFGLFAFGGLGLQFLAHFPHVVVDGACGAGVVGAGFVDHVDFEAFGVGLSLARYADVYSIQFAVGVGVELGLDPEVVAYPHVGVFESLDDLGLSVLDEGHCGVVFVLGE